jgi:outer membrane murein-binding lipoprotein Lpp
LQFLQLFEEATPKIARQMQCDRTARSMLLAFATMVDSRKGGVMADRIDHLTERVQVVEMKVDRLSSTVGQLSTRVDGLTTTVGQLSTTVNELSTAMAAGFVEQREYTEFSHARLEVKMDTAFGRVDRKLDQLIDAQRPRAKPKRRNE